MPRSRAPLRVQSLRVNNVEIPNSKRVEISLQYIYGIGSTTAKQILVNTVSGVWAGATQQQLGRWRQRVEQGLLHSQGTTGATQTGPQLGQSAHTWWQPGTAAEEMAAAGKGPLSFGGACCTW